MNKNLIKILALASAMTIAFSSCDKFEKLKKSVSGENSTVSSNVSNNTKSGDCMFDTETGGAGNLICIMGLTSSMLVPDLSLLTANGDNPFEYICRNGGGVQTIIADGDPKNSIKDSSIKEPLDPKDYTSMNYEKKIKRYTSDLMKKVKTNIAPKVEETSPIDALNVASEVLKNKSGQKAIAIFHSGIITTSYGEMNNLDFDVDAYIDALQQNECLPDLKGVKVRWYGLCEVAGEQGVPTEKNRKNLEAFWTRLFELTGADFSFGSSIYTERQLPDSTFPSVKSVDVGDRSMPETGEEATFDETIIYDITNDDIGFVPDTADIIDIETARKAVQPFVECLKSPDFVENIVLIGTTAEVGDAESSVILSKERADAIKALIVAEGVPENRILTFGAGYNDKNFYIDDHAKDGSLIESVAQQNRCVHVMLSINKFALPYLN